MSNEQDTQIEDKQSAPSATHEHLQDTDRHVLEVAQLNRKLALKEAETALAKNEAAEAGFKLTLMNIYMKYKLDPVSDGLSEDGKILRGQIK